MDNMTEELMHKMKWELFLIENYTYLNTGPFSSYSYLPEHLVVSLDPWFLFSDAFVRLIAILLPIIKLHSVVLCNYFCSLTGMAWLGRHLYVSGRMYVRTNKECQILVRREVAEETCNLFHKRTRAGGARY